MSPSKYVIVCLALASDPNAEAPRGQMLKSYDPEVHRGLGEAEWTHDLSEAMLFNSAREAHGLWVSSPKSRPIRDDYKPNRPLTAFSIEIAAVEA